jgi:hypothetical protein
VSARAAFTVSGPLEEDHPVPALGPGISCAQTFASRRRRDEGEFSYYVRDEAGAGRAIVTKTAGGIIETRVTV